MSNQPSDSPSHNYRPRSPDLSGFVAPPLPRLNRLPSVPYNTSGDSGFPPGYSFSPRGSYDASPYFSPQATQPISYFGAQSQPQSQSQASQSSSQPFFSQPQPFSQSDNDEMARLRARNQRVNYNDDNHRIDEFDQTVAPITQQSFSQFPPQPQSLSSAPQIMPQPQLHQPAFQQQPPLQPFPQQIQQQPFQSMPQQPPPQHQPSTLPQIDIRTKFPVARIKRIMQADEDIGKVAQATPTAVAKALELFMIALVSKGSLNAKESSSKRVTATHLKNALLSDSQFDFLTEICENVPDEGSGGAKRKKAGEGGTKSEESDADEEIVGAGQQKKKGRVRKKKGQSGEESD